MLRLGFAAGEREGSISRYRAPEAKAGAVVDLHVAGGLMRGGQGAGSVHHVAFRAADDADQAEMVRQLAQDHGLQPAPQKNRAYFRSVSFREPGRVLFEIATEPPGFSVDESIETLGRGLKLPPALEAQRTGIEARLPALE